MRWAGVWSGTTGPTVAEIAAKLPSQDYKFSQLVLGIVEQPSVPDEAALGEAEPGYSSA